MKSIKLPLFLLMLVLPTVVQAQFIFTTNNGAITIASYTGSGGVVFIPSITNGLPVLYIGENAFQGCTNLTGAIIPNTVTNIAEDAFSFCTMLTNIVIPNSVTNIGNYALYGCTSLNNVVIPSTVKSVGNSAFSDCTGLVGVYFQGNTPSLGSSVFLGDNNATMYYGSPWLLPPYNFTGTNGAITITGYSGSNGLVSIPSVMIGWPVTSISPNRSVFIAFTAASLTNLTIPNSVTNIAVDIIGENEFAGCPSLVSIAVATNNPAYSSVSGVLFNQNQTALIAFPPGKSGAYVIPNSVTNIGAGSFFNCQSLTSITIPSGVTSIEESAFNGCASLTDGGANFFL